MQEHGSPNFDRLPDNELKVAAVRNDLSGQHRHRAVDRQVPDEQPLTVEDDRSGTDSSKRLSGHMAFVSVASVRNMSAGPAGGNVVPLLAGHRRRPTVRDLLKAPLPAPEATLTSGSCRVSRGGVP